MVTLIQLYKLGENVGVDIFDGLTLPDGSPLDRETVINSIIERCGMNYPMYADVNVMASAITLWSAKNQYTFNHVGKIYSAEYSPIENTDKYDTITVKHDLTDNTKLSNGKNESIANSGTDGVTVEDSVSAENAGDYQPDSKTTTTTVYGSSSAKETNINGSNDKTVDENTTTTEHIHGNIGVSTNSTLQIEDYNLIRDYNPYDFIAGLFENSLTLCIY